MKEYRCTRNDLYAHDCLGHDNIKVRQGHYIWADSRIEAKETMHKQYPEDWHGFTADETGYEK